MLNLTTAIYGKISGSSFATDIGSRLYKGRAPANAVYPYCVYTIVTIQSDNTFSEDYEDVLIQFSIFSSASGTTEIENAFTHLKALYDDCSLTITSETLICMKRVNAIFQPEDHITVSGTQRVWSYHVDYSVMVKV